MRDGISKLFFFYLNRPNVDAPIEMNQLQLAQITSVNCMTCQSDIGGTLKIVKNEIVQLLTVLFNEAWHGNV